MKRTLTHSEARAFYDKFGAKQDLQRFYEDPAIERLLGAADLGRAEAVIELGCGTGRLAERLLRSELPPGATYTGFDVSGTMVELTKERLAPWAGRASVEQSDGSARLPRPQSSFRIWQGDVILAG